MRDPEDGDRDRRPCRPVTLEAVGQVVEVGAMANTWQSAGVADCPVRARDGTSSTPTPGAGSTRTGSSRDMPTRAVGRVLVRASVLIDSLIDSAYGWAGVGAAIGRNSVSYR